MKNNGIHCHLASRQQNILSHGILLNFVCACKSYGRMSRGCVVGRFQKNMVYKRQIIGLSCHIVFQLFENLRHSLSSSIPSISGLIAGASKKSIVKNKKYQEKTLKITLCYCRSKQLGRIVSFVIKSKVNIFGLTSQFFIVICAAVLEI